MIRPRTPRRTALPSAALFLLLAALPLCACGPAQQPPLTAGEADKFVHDNPLVQERGTKVRKSLGIMNPQERDRIVNQAKREKVAELGWDPDRFRYIHNLFYQAFRMKSYGEILARLQREMNDSPSPSKLEQLRQTYGHMRTGMAKMGKHIEETLTIPERTLINERLAVLPEPFDESAPTFKWHE